MPATDRIVHFGKGQTDHITLPPGRLRCNSCSATLYSASTVISKKITITVKP